MARLGGYEYYNVDLNHFFRTESRPESISVLSGGAGAGWRDTKGYFLAWRQASQGAVPVCRFYGTPGKGPNSHFYTADPGECSQVKSDPGWTYEGIAFYVKLPVSHTCPGDAIPIYRLYNNRWTHSAQYKLEIAIMRGLVSRGKHIKGRHEYHIGFSRYL